MFKKAPLGWRDRYWDTESVNSVEDSGEVKDKTRTGRLTNYSWTHKPISHPYISIIVITWWTRIINNYFCRLPVDTLTEKVTQCLCVCIQGWWSRALMTIEGRCHSMKPHKPPPISCLICKSLAGASQRSAMAILRFGLIGRVVIVITTASQDHPHTTPSHTCPAHALEQSMAALGGDWLLRIQQEVDWLFKAPEASTPLCPLSSSLLLLICQRSQTPLRFQVSYRGRCCLFRCPSTSWTQVRVRVRSVIAALICSRKSPRRGFVCASSVGKGLPRQQI